MSETVKHTYTVKHLFVDVTFNKSVVSIDFTPFERKEELSLLYQASYSLVKQIKLKYQQIYHEKLCISNNSFIAEIWGHVLAYRMALWIKKHINIKLIQRFAKFVAFRSGLIDCGENKVDTNRWIWDIWGRLFFNKVDANDQTR